MIQPCPAAVKLTPGEVTPGYLGHLVVMQFGPDEQQFRQRLCFLQKQAVHRQLHDRLQGSACMLLTALNVSAFVMHLAGTGTLPLAGRCP